MKKLSEIGVRHDRLEGYVTLPEPVVWLTLAERRELVRRVCTLLCKEWIYPEDAWADIEKAAMSQIDGLIKEQGL